MSRPEYLVVAEYIGTGDNPTYTFDFKISDLSQLLILKVKDDFTKVFNVRGDAEDVSTYISALTFDASAGGGEITLVSNLETGYHLAILMANDAPTQPQKFKDKGEFTLSLFEKALDLQNGAIQRVSYLAQRSLRLVDSFPSTDSFDVTIPIHSTDTNVESNADKVLAVGDDNKSFKLGPTTASIFAAEASAQQAASDAEDAASAALVSQSAAAVSAAAAAASLALITPAILETFIGSKGTPQAITAAGGVPFTSVTYQTTMFASSGAAGVVNVTAAKRIAAGTVKGQRLTIVGSDDANYFDVTDNNGVVTFGKTVRHGLNSISKWIWDETNWILDYYNGVMP